MNIEDLYPSVLPSVRGCPHITALGALQASAIEFCRRTQVWQKTLPAISSTANPLTFTAALVGALGGTLAAPFDGTTRTDYILMFSDGSTQTVTLNNGSTAVTWANPVTAGTSATYSQVTYALPSITDAEVCKLLRYSVNGIKKAVVMPDVGEDMVAERVHTEAAWLSADRKSFNVTPAPALPGTQYQLKVVLQPTRDALTLPDDIGMDFGEDIAFGALWRLHRMDKREWSSDDNAADNLANFNRRIAIVAAQVSKGFSRGRARTRGYYF